MEIISKHKRQEYIVETKSIEELSKWYDKINLLIAQQDTQGKSADFASALQESNREVDR